MHGKEPIYNFWEEGFVMANNNNGGGGLSFWGMVGAVLVALIIFSLFG